MVGFDVCYSTTKLENYLFILNINLMFYTAYSLRLTNIAPFSRRIKGKFHFQDKKIFTFYYDGPQQVCGRRPFPIHSSFVVFVAECLFLQCSFPLLHGGVVWVRL